MTEISAQLDNIKVSNFNGKIQNELEYFKTIAILTPFENGHGVVIEERIELLEQILKQPGLHQNTVQQQRDNMFVEIDKYTYRKQWNKLPSFHKTVKISEYLEKHIQDKKMKKQLLEELTDHANNGRINTKKYVIYDPNEEKILSLPCLKIIKNDDKKESYKLDIV